MAAVLRTQLLIVGAGPCGLVTAIAAARYGIQLLLIEQREQGSSLFRALVISTRGMELIRRFGLEDAVRAGAADVDLTALVTTTLASDEAGTVMQLGYPSDAEALRVSPTRPAWAPQSHHEFIASLDHVVADRAHALYVLKHPGRRRCRSRASRP